jgi:lipopolysaccharide heptosyltransferase II
LLRKLLTKIILNNLPDISKINKVLVVRLSSMGDVILTTPVVSALRKSLPGARIDFITAKNFSEIYKYSPHLSNLFEYDKSWTISEVQNFKEQILNNSGGKYDIAIDLQKNLRTSILLRGMAGKISAYSKNRLHKLSLVHLKKPLRKNFSVVENYLQTISDFAETGNDGLEIRLKDETAKGSYPPEKRNNNYSGKLKIALAPGAHFFTKRWPPEYFGKLINLIKENFDAEIYLAGGNDDVEICTRVKQIASFEVFDYSGAGSILETAGLVDKCDLLITNDTGVMHIGAARRVPVIAIFGSTVTELGFAPYKVKSEIAGVELDCRPCTHIGRDSCPKGHFRCMRDIKPEDIIEKINLILTKKD